MTEQESYGKLAKDPEYLGVARTKRKARLWWHKQQENMPQRLEDYTNGVLAERERILEILEADRCEDGGCLQCDSTDFHIEVIKKGDNPSAWEALFEKRQDD